MKQKDRLKCILCKSNKIIKKFVINRFEPQFIIYECKNCGFQFKNPEKVKVDRYYSRDYYEGRALYSYVDERKNEKAFRIVWKSRIKKWMNLEKTEVKGKNFLDVGCSFGGLMLVAKEKGYKAYGVEVSKYSGKYAAKRFGKKYIMIGNIEKLRLPATFFSIVSLIEVIEHLSNPVKAIQNIYRSLRRGGILIIQTANMAGLQARLAGKNYHYYLPGHFSYFSAKNLKQLLKDIGFSKIKIFGGTEFGLLPKLMKSRYTFRSILDYRHWIRIFLYHYLSKVRIGGLHLTSSMVVICWK